MRASCAAARRFTRSLMSATSTRILRGSLLGTDSCSSCTLRQQARRERGIITVVVKGGGSGTHVGTFGCTCDQSRAGFDCMGLGFDQRFLGTRTLFFFFFAGFSAGGGLAS